MLHPASRNKSMPENIIAQIKVHIESFPARESHYSRRDSARKSLSPDLNVALMHKLYLQKYEPDTYMKMKEGEKNVKPIVNYEYCNNIFNTQYNFRFGRPRVDALSLIHI